LTGKESASPLSIARRLEQGIRRLEESPAGHPDESEASSPLALFCDVNPTNINSRVDDD
jgi:hypothetical protein